MNISRNGNYLYINLSYGEWYTMNKLMTEQRKLDAQTRGRLEIGEDAIGWSDNEITIELYSPEEG